MAAKDSNKPLSTLTLNALKAGKTVSDSGEYRGLRVVCGQSGVKTFIYRYRSPSSGKIKQFKIGRYISNKLEQALGSMSLAEARVRFLELKALRDGGVCLVEQRQEEQEAAKKLAEQAQTEQALAQFTVEKLCEAYLSDCIDGHRTKKSAAEARRALYGDPVAKLGELPAADITSKQIVDLIMKIVDRGANVQAGFILRELTAAFDHAIDSELPDDYVNPCYQAKGRLKRKRVRLTSQKGTRVLNDGELAELLRWLPGSKFTPGQKGVLHFTLMTGCRTGEACAMRWTDVDLESGVWCLKETKTGVPRNVQLPEQAMAFLRQQRRISNDYVFPQITGRPVQQKTLTERTWHMRKNNCFIELEPWSPHDLRRSVRTGLARMGCPSEVAEAVLGHSRKGIEGVYNLHSYEQECRAWLQRWCDHLDELMSSKSIVSLGARNVR